ncbi:hypothetical protein HMPREF0322_04362 [Desulfitobacterium hafniense DP7]|uniref:Uncharacterized protein n=1 Tax=Desulfitobacterium hafniense DP7 TaxID=537010 RepID=G9XTQ5_DESHA|nr:hypothetical protein HMPREF0322_04362 [Desulfitobacterium hafniense DP7]
MIFNIIFALFFVFCHFLFTHSPLFLKTGKGTLSFGKDPFADG